MFDNVITLLLPFLTLIFWVHLFFDLTHFLAINISSMSNYLCLISICQKDEIYVKWGLINNYRQNLLRKYFLAKPCSYKVEHKYINIFLSIIIDC